jgi:hypothetical protein
MNNNAIVGGRYNYIISDICNTNYNFIGGGRNNLICGYNVYSAYDSSILGGANNCISKGCNVHIIGSGINAGGTNDITYMNNVKIFGNLAKGTGTFEISHPNPEKTKTHKLIHSFVESPTAGDNIYRYEVEVKDGVAIIELPDYYEYLNENTQIWVTAKNGFGVGYGVVSEDLKIATIYANKDLTYNILIIGTRKDIKAKENWKGVEVEKTELMKLQKD